MPRLHESFYRSDEWKGCRTGDIIILVIISLSLFSIGTQTTSMIEKEEKEK